MLYRIRDSTDLSLDSYFCFYSFFLLKINIQHEGWLGLGGRVVTYSVILEKLVVRHLRTNPFDKYGV